MGKYTAPLYVLVGVLFAALISYGTFDLIGHEWLSISYDSLGKHLLRGEAFLDDDTIIWEGLPRDGKIYMYFGPFPAFVRVILNLIYPEGYGQWARVSCLMGSLISVCAFGGMASWALRTNSSLSESAKPVVWFFVTLAFALGTPVVFLISCGRIYHEALIWGLAGGMMGLYAIIKVSCEGEATPRMLFLFSCAFFVALLSRLTFAIPMVLALPFVVFYGVFGRNYGLQQLGLRLCCTLPALIAAVVQLWYNYARFKNVWKVFDFSVFYLKPDLIGGTFNLARIPSVFANYGGFSWDYFSTMSPFFRMLTTRTSRPELFMQGWREETISLWVASTWLMVIGVVGLYFILRRFKQPLLAVYVLCLSVQCMFILGYFFVTQRFAAEFLPLLALGAFGFLSCARLSRPVLGGLCLLCSISIPISIITTLHWAMAHNGNAPDRYRSQLAKMFFPGVDFDDGVPNPDWGYLSDLTPVAEEFSFNAVKINRGTLGDPLMAYGRIFPRGLGMHANGSVTYAVPEGAKTFLAIVSVSPSGANCGKASLQFEVKNHSGASLFQSRVMTGESSPEDVSIDVRSSKTISLIVSDAGDGRDCDHANWYIAAFNK